MEQYEPKDERVKTKNSDDSEMYWRVTINGALFRLQEPLLSYTKACALALADMSKIQIVTYKGAQAEGEARSPADIFSIENGMRIEVMTEDQLAIKKATK
jgi:hypothetical protein